MLAAVKKAHPHVKFFCFSKAENLNEKAYIVPALGNIRGQNFRYAVIYTIHRSGVGIHTVFSIVNI